MEGYTTLSKTLFSRGDLLNSGCILRLHAGGSFTHYSGEAKANIGSFFGGLSFKQTNGLGLVVDYIPVEKSDGVTLSNSTFSFSVRYPFTPGTYIEVGTTKPFDSDQETLYCGFTVRYGGENTEQRQEPDIE